MLYTMETVQRTGNQQDKLEIVQMKVIGGQVDVAY